MKLEEYINKIKFYIFAQKYYEKTDMPLILVNDRGELVYKNKSCSLCYKLNIYKKNLSNCKIYRIKIISESLRWGEPYISTCPMGLITFSIPIIYKRELLGGLISGFIIFPEMEKDINDEIILRLKKNKFYLKEHKNINMKIKKITMKNAIKFSNYLLKLAVKMNFTDINVLNENKERYIQQYKIANFLEDIVYNNKKDIAASIVEKQDELIEKVKLGDYTGAKKILNKFLGFIFFDSNMNFDIIKVRLIELIVIISRAAMEDGIKAKDLLGLKYNYLTKLNKTETIEDLSFIVTKILYNFIIKVKTEKSKNVKQKVDKIKFFLENNFTKKISLQEISSFVGISVSRIAHLFKEETGISISDYIKKQRIKYSKYLLLNTDLSIADISNETGFFDQSHFTKCFKYIEKITPLQFKKKYYKKI